MLKTYRQKIETIKTFKAYMIQEIAKLDGIAKVSGNRIDIITPQPYPLVVVNYMDGLIDSYRQSVNAKMTFEITIVQNVEDESDALDLVARIAEIFESITHEGRVIGSRPQMPENYFERLDGVLNVKTVLEIEIEI